MLQKTARIHACYHRKNLRIQLVAVCS